MKAEALVGRSVTVAVPATVANLGAGYDVLGLALEMTNELTVQVTGVSASGKGTVTYGASGEGAEELAQDVMITVWQKAGMYDRNQASVSTWMFRIARNRRIDAQRRQRRPELTADDPMLRPPEIEQPDALLARDQLEGIVRSELVKLPLDQLRLLQAARGLCRTSCCRRA